MRDFLVSLRFMVSTAFRAAPVLSSLDLAFMVVVAIAAPIQTYGIKTFIDGISGRQQDISTGLALILGAVLALMLGQIVSESVSQSTRERVSGLLHADLAKLTASIPGITQHEQPEVADEIELVRQDAPRMRFGFSMVFQLVAMVVSSVAVLVMLAAIHPALLLLPLLGLLRIWAAARSGTMWRTAQRSTAHLGRLIARFTDIAESPRNALEVRAFGQERLLLSRTEQLYEEQNGPRWAATRDGGRLEIGVRVLYGLAYGGAIAFVIWLIRNGSASVGDLVLLVMLAPQVDGVASGVAMGTRNIGEGLKMFGRVVWLQRYAREHSWPDADTPAPDRLHNGIRLTNVSFAYPGAEQPSLSSVNLHLPAGTSIALVGENGAGKSTLVKLLARMYDPTDGTIDVDDTDLKTIDPAAWRARTSAGFQDFVKFQFQARESIGVGDLEADFADVAVQKAADRGDAAAVLEKLPDGLDSQLGPEFSEGSDLSGGQWQRVALARAFMRERPLLLLLDEPTAALDPEAEHKLYERFADAARVAAKETGGITVLVSHRFSTVRMADLIVVLENGQVREFGTHEQLLANSGRYSELFELQARAYR